jgi:hypothetical protein
MYLLLGQSHVDYQERARPAPVSVWSAAALHMTQVNCIAAGLAKFRSE